MTRLTKAQHRRMVEDALVWVRRGVQADYHAIIGDPVTKPGVVVLAGPERSSSGTWVCWVEGVRGYVAVEALTPAASPQREEKG